MNATDLSAFGFGSATYEPSSVGARSSPLASDRRSEARFAVVLLAGALSCVYAISGATAIGQAPAAGALLLAVAVLQAGWLLALRQRPGRALLLGSALNVLLVAIWALSRTRGLPIGDGAQQPVGLVDALCAADAAAIAVLAWRLNRPLGRRIARAAPLLSQWAIVLAVSSLGALAGGHTHGQRVAGDGSARGQVHIYCRLLGVDPSFDRH